MAGSNRLRWVLDSRLLVQGEAAIFLSLLWDGFPDNAGRVLRVLGRSLYQLRQGFKIGC